jgi:hypothetical protein
MESAIPTGSAPRSLSFHEFLSQFSPGYLQRFGAAMPLRQREVLPRILRCRTPELGGQLFACPDCQRWRFRYYSCNDRHCPLCGQADAQEWLQRQQRRLLLPVPYFLVTFTLPEPLRAWVRAHPKLGYDLLFAASAQALQDLASNPKYLGAQLALLGVLHTWSRTLIFHPHIHYLVPGGGLSADGRTWSHTGQEFFVHFAPLKRRFRTVFAELLRKQAPELWTQIPSSVWQQDWNINLQAVGSGEKALQYLARYIFKTATANRRLQLLPEGKVRWPYRQSQTGQWTHLDLEPDELLRRFLQHILPQGYCRVRCFGWYHPAAKVRANRVRALLRQAPVLSAAEEQTWQMPPAGPGWEPAAPVKPPPAPAPLCPCCRIPMVLRATWRAGPRPPLAAQPRPP